jgi:signal transduction protein with GAF and PtsI domain
MQGASTVHVSDLKSPGGEMGERGKAAELQVVHEVATEILSHLDVEATLLSVTNAAAALLDADIAGLMLADANDDVLEMQACTGHRTVETAHLQVQPGQGVAGKVFETGAPVNVDDYLTDSSISQDFAAIAKEEGKRSALGAPMSAQAEFIGVLLVWRRRPSVFDGEDTRRLINLASLGTIAIVNAPARAAAQCGHAARRGQQPARGAKRAAAPLDTGPRGAHRPRARRQRARRHRRDPR